MDATLPQMLSSTTNVTMGTSAKMAMSMGDSTCKLSMLLNWQTIDACFLSSTFHIRSSFEFFLACVGSALLVIFLEFLRRCQRHFDRYLRSKNELLQDRTYAVAEETNQQLLSGHTDNPTRGRKLTSRTVLEQAMRGIIHAAQFAVSYCIMLMYMYSNGYIILSVILGALIGFSLFTRDTLHLQYNIEAEDRDKSCC